MSKKPITTDESATLLTHVRELQIRLLVTAVVLVGAGTVAWFYYGQILDILRAPLNAPLYYSSVSGSFAFVMKICMVAGVAVSVPLIVYNFIMFVRPAFVEVFTKKRVFMMTSGSILAAAGGAAFGFLFVVPGALHFFSGFQVHGLHELISADSYLNFVINVLITFVLAFQLPILVSLIDRIKPISPRMMWKGEKWALIGSIIIAIIVPFAMDFMTQLFIAAPIFILYNISFVVVALQHTYGHKVARKTARVEARAAHKLEKQAQKPITRPARRRPALATAAAANTSLAPNPQLAETFELLARQASKQPVKTVKAVTIASPVQHVMTEQPLVAPQPIKQQPVVSMDGMSLRTRPTSVIRQAGTIQKAPARDGAQARPLRPMNLMADIR